MKAAVYCQNGGPEVLCYEDVPDPTCPEDGVVLGVEVISMDPPCSGVARPSMTSEVIEGARSPRSE
jgi:NADPH:quinone reductase-like Zn-dependent oxidoreductase